MKFRSLYGVLFLALFASATVHYADAAAKDYYRVLEVDRSASAKDLKAAYKKLSLKWHPDKNSDPDAQSKFIEISEAYSVLSDPAKRRSYDTFARSGGGGDEWSSGTFTAEDAAAMFESFLEELEGFMQDADKLDDLIHQILGGEKDPKKQGWMEWAGKSLLKQVGKRVVPWVMEQAEAGNLKVKIDGISHDNIFERRTRKNRPEFVDGKRRMPKQYRRPEAEL